MAKGSQPLRVLLVEDNPDDAELLLRELRRSGFQPDWQRVDTEAEYLAALNPELDLVLSDYAMPRFSGLRALELLNGRKLDVPFLIVSGTIGEETAVEAMRSGAADYLLKDRLARLGQAVTHTLEQSRLRKERENAEEAMRQSEHKYRHLFESLSEAAFLIDAKSRRVLDVNRCAEKLLGRTRTEILGMNGASLFPADSADDYAKLIDAGACGSGDLDEAQIQSKDGTTVPVRMSFAPIKLHGRDLILALMADVTERKRAEGALSGLRRQYELILNSAGEGIYGIDLEGNINFINPKGAALLGWTVAELLGKPAHATIHYRKSDGSSFPIESCAIHGSMRAPASRRVTNDILWRKNGTSFRVDYVAAPIRDESGEVRGCIVTFKDITEQFIADARHKLQAEQYRLLFETNPNPMWVFEAKRLQILAVNEQAIKQYGYSRKEFLNLTLKDLRPTDDVSELDNALTQPSAPAHASGHFRHKKKDGSLIFADVYSGPIVWEGVMSRIVTAIDVTERKRAEERVREQADIINRAHDAVIVRDFESDQVMVWNRGAERLYGWSESEAIGRPMGELIFADASGRKTRLEQLVATGEFHGEIKHRTKDSRDVIVDSRVTLIRDEKGAPHSILGISTDITEQKKLETQLLRSQRLESIGTLASGVAHDLNNILTPILMCVETLRDKSFGEDAESSISLIEQSARRGAGIVKQVLTFARGVEGKRVLIRPNHLIEEMIDIARKTFPKSIEIRSRYPEDLWSIEADPTQLHQVLLNLCVNARDAMPNGGSLLVSAENFTASEEYAAATPEASAGPYIILRVSDTGAGMPSATIDRIFDPFFTTKETSKGTGLGLSTTLGIAKSHGGFISVHSQVGSGTTFRVFLPAVAEETKSRKADVMVKPSNGNGELVLLVDDEPSILKVTQTILERHNYRVLAANDGPEALALIGSQKDPISVVLTDIAMPRMGGVEFVREVRKMRPRMNFIASTGHGEDSHVSELQELNVTNFLAKPYDAEKLLTTLRGTLAGIPKRSR